MDLGLKVQVKGLDYIKKVEKATNNMTTDVQQKINSVFDSCIAALGKR